MFIFIRKLIRLKWDLITRSPAVARIADCTGCQWHSRSSEINDFHLIWQNVCHFPLVINSNLGRIFYHFRDIASFPLKNAHFSYPRFIQLPIWKLLPLEYIAKILHARVSHTWLIIRANVFPYDPLQLARVHPLKRDEQTDDCCLNRVG